MPTDDPDLRTLARYFISRVASAEDVQAFFHAFPGASDPAIDAHFSEVMHDAEQMDAADQGTRMGVVCGKIRLFRLCRLIGVDRALSEETQHCAGLCSAWIDSATWEQAQAFLHQHEVLLTDAARELLRVMAEIQLSDSDAAKVLEHLALLDECRVSGIAAAFRKKFEGLSTQRLDALVGVVRKLIFASSAAEWIDHLSRHPILLGGQGSGTWLMGWESAPDQVAQLVQKYLCSYEESPALPAFERNKILQMRDFMRQASFGPNGLSYPREHALLKLLDSGSPPTGQADTAAEGAARMPGRADYFAARRSRSDPGETPVADFMGLRECKRLGSGGRSMLYAGRNAEGALTVAKFYPGAREDGSAAYERDEARLMYAANYGLSRWCVLPIEGHASQVACPDDASAIGWAYTTPWCVLGSLRDRLDFGRLDTYERVLVLLNAAICLRGLHEADIIHGDVKPDNFLFWEPGDVTAVGGGSPLPRVHLVLSDLGSSTYLRNPALRRGRSGTPAYQPPESLAGAPPAFSNDVWAWGGVAIELFTGAVPGEHLGLEPQVLQEIQSAGCPLWLSGLVQACRAGEPGARPSFADIVRCFAQYCEVRVDAAPGTDPTASGLVFGLNDLPGETTERSPELFEKNTTPWHVVVSSPGILDTVRTVEALLRDNRHESFVEAFRIIHKRFACDGGQASLMRQLQAHPDADTFVNPPTRPCGPREIMGPRAPIPNSHAYAALDLYLNAIVLVRQHCLDPQAENEGRNVVEFFGFGQPGCAVAGRLEPTTVMSLLVLFGSAQDRSLYLPAVDAQLNDADPARAAGAAAVLSHCLLADGNVAGAIVALGNAATFSLRANAEEATRNAASAAALCALDDNVQLLMQLAGKVAGTPIWNTLASTDLWQLSTRYLDCGYQLRPDPLFPMRDLLLGGGFFVEGVSVRRLWLGCACLWRLGEREAAARLTRVVAQDERLALPFNRPFAQAVQQLLAKAA